MKVLQWIMTIPKEKQKDFKEASKGLFGPMWKKFGALDYKCFKIGDKKLIGRQTIESDRYVEQLYFDDSFDIPNFFTQVKEDKEANKISQKYEKEYGAHNIELRMLNSLELDKNFH